MMSADRKARCLSLAEVIDAYRVFPRLFLVMFFAGYCWLMLQSWQWYVTLPFTELDWANLSALTAFPTLLLTGLGGMFTSMYKHYQESGRDWSKK